MATMFVRKAVLLLLCMSCGQLHLAAAQGYASAPAPDVPPQLVWLPPDDPTSACSPAVFNHFTKHNPSCAYAFYFRKDPDADCCEGLAHYFGPNTTHPSRNCYCDANTWAKLADVGDNEVYYSFSSAFDMCAHMGFPVGYNAEPGVGYCYGKPPSADELAAAHITHSDADILREAIWDSTEAYFKKLDKDSLITFSFVTSIFSGVGIMLLVWPLLVDSAISSVNLWNNLVAGRRA